MKKFLVLSTILLSSPAFAQTPVNGVDVKPGETIITLNATERTKIKQDLLQASLRIELEGKDAKKIQNDINEAMQKALAATKDVKSVKTSTGQYYVYSYENGEPPVKPNASAATKREKIWKGSQTIDLEGQDQAAVLDLAGKIQDMGFVTSQLSYTLTPEESETYKDNLMVKALAKLQRKASLAAKSLNKANFEILEVNVDNSGMIPPMPIMYKRSRMEGMAATAQMAEPVAQASEQDVELNVNARILLKP